MSNFIEFTTPDNKIGKLLVNKYHVTTVAPDYTNTTSIIRLNNSLEYHILENYETVKSMLNPVKTLTESE